MTRKITVNMCITPDGHSEFQDYPGPDAQLNEPGAAAGIYTLRFESEIEWYVPKEDVSMFSVNLH